MKKGIKVILLIGTIFLFLIIADTLSINLRRMPLFILKNDNNVYKGLLYDTYYCPIPDKIYVKSKWNEFTCETVNDSDNNVNVENGFKVVDDTSNKTYPAVIEDLYEDEYNSYYLSYPMSNDIHIIFDNGEKYNIKEALDLKKVTIEQLIDNNVNLNVKPKFYLKVNLEKDKESIKKIDNYNLIYKNIENVCFSKDENQYITLEEALLTNEISK